MKYLKNNDGEYLFILSISSSECAFPEVHICTEKKCIDIIGELMAPVDGKIIDIISQQLDNNQITVVTKNKYKWEADPWYQYIQLEPAIEEN